MSECKETVDELKSRMEVMEGQWNTTSAQMDNFITDVKNKPIETTQLAPIIKGLDEVKTTCSNNSDRVQQIEKYRKSLNIIITGLLPRHSDPPGLCEFAYTEMGVNLAEHDISQIMVIAESHEKVVHMHLIRFSNQRARNEFFKGRIQLSPRVRVWINEDLTKLPKISINFMFNCVQTTLLHLAFVPATPRIRGNFRCICT